MISRERVISVLNKQPVDRVPWIEGIVGNGIASRVCNEPINVDWSVAPNGTPVKSGAELAEEQKKVNRVFGKDNINFNAFAPIFAHRMKKLEDSPVVVGDGMIRTEEDFEKIFKLPPVDNPTFIKNARGFISQKEVYCAIATVRLGIGATLLSMGFEGFSYAMADNPDLIRKVHNNYTKWTEELIPILEELGFDVIWAFDDIAFNSGPIFSPHFYEKEILPVEKKATEKITIPLIIHSDGNMNSLLDLWIKLQPNAIHPIQPNVMDIYKVRQKLPENIGIVGNIDMDLLVHGTPREIETLVKERMEKLKPTGNYLISSSNSLTDDMKPENVRTMISVIRKYGKY